MIDESTDFLDVSSFMTQTPEDPVQIKVHDMRQGSIPFKRTRKRPRMGMMMYRR